MFVVLSDKCIFLLSVFSAFICGVFAVAVGLFTYAGGFGAAAIFFALFVVGLIKYYSLWRHKENDFMYFIITDLEELRLIACRECNVVEWLGAVCGGNGTKFVGSFTEFMEEPGNVMILKGKLLEQDPRSA